MHERKIKLAPFVIAYGHTTKWPDNHPLHGSDQPVKTVEIVTPCLPHAAEMLYTHLMLRVNSHPHE
jgi:hypothetical protein